MRRKIVAALTSAALVFTLALSPAAGPLTAEAESVGSQNMYRMYNKTSGEHFYTAEWAERDNLVSSGWDYEGIGWVAPQTSYTPVYRLYNKFAGDHHYTTGIDERDLLVKSGWVDEGIGWYSDDAKTVPLYRQYNNNAKTGTHNYTTSKAENDALAATWNAASKTGWQAEGIGWYGLSESTDKVGIIPSGDFPLYFTFSSGAGGWATDIVLQSNGDFKGHWYDGNFETVNGKQEYVIDYCDFHGTFSNITKRDNNSYSMTLSSLIYDSKAGTKEVKGTGSSKSTYRVANVAYGMEKGIDYIYFVKGTPVSTITGENANDFLSWNYDWRAGKLTSLPGYALWNVGSGDDAYGFFSVPKESSYFGDSK